MSMFEDIAHDYIALKSKYDIPFCLIGHFNARTGELSDFVGVDDFSLEEAGLENTATAFNSRDELEALGVFTVRVNEDKITNNNGHCLIELCRSLDRHRVNGRIGKDKNIGGCTFDRKSKLIMLLCLLKYSLKC